MAESLEHLDEVWVCSEFNRAAIAAHTDKPVRVVPHPAHPPAPSDVRLDEIPDDGTFTFLFVFDHFSGYRRKNPAGLLEAFTRAFPEPGEARLVIKSINGDKHEANREHLRYLAAQRPDVVLVERYLTRPELDGLMRHADCYVSLHRSEGFGQTLAETMAIGKPVIATGYSGNLDFTRADNSLLVPYSLTEVGPGSEPYDPDAMWAEPDLDEAARLMRAVWGDAELRARLGRVAERTIAEEYSTGALASVIRGHLQEIWATATYRRRRTRRAAPLPEPAASAGPVVATTSRRRRRRT
jgi:glycosyltransferase involved in cell wall biosynthesis